MIRSLYTAATGMDAQQSKMDTIANNLANVSTPGFKKTRLEFEDLLYERIHSGAAPDVRGGTPPAPLEVGLGVKTVSSYRNFGQGDYLNTGNELDVAIEGDGLFRVRRPSGDIAYTRAGNLRVDAEGRLVTQRGEPLEPEIIFPPETTSVTINPDGTVMAMTANNEQPVNAGNIELVLFTNPAGLNSLGGNLFVETPASGMPTIARPGERGAGAVNQGFLENSNVKAVEEMIDMISTQRAYELNSKVIQTADQMLQKLTSLR